MTTIICHEKGSRHKQANKKEDCCDRMDNVFKMLPEALQWEILTDFVGGFAVRFNRLRRLFSGELQNKIMEHIFDMNYLSLRSLWAKPFVNFPLPANYHLIPTILNRWSGRTTSVGSDGQIRDNDDPDRLRIVAAAEFSHRGSSVVLFECKDTGRLSYGVQCGHMKRDDGRWYIRDVDESVTLPPYEKHIYPSYPYTNKKLERPVQKMKLHNPVPKVPEGLLYHEIKAWLEGHRF
jgi:hypothetical protein